MPETSPASSRKRALEQPRQRRDPPAHSPSHRDLLLSLSPEDWAKWRHHPITAAFLLFLQDQRAVWRELAADLVECGALDPTATHEDRNPHVIRGKLSAVAQMQQIGIDDIQSFYTAQDGEEQA